MIAEMNPLGQIATGVFIMAAFVLFILHAEKQAKLKRAERENLALREELERKKE